jgi:hypothetical protein
MALWSITMDPLSTIASAIAVSQALGVGVKAFRSLANAPSEFSDMLRELSSLQASTSQLCSVLYTMADPGLSFHSDVANRLEMINFELSQILGAMRDINARLSSGKPPDSIGLKRNGTQMVSIINWQRERGKAIKLRDRAKSCREDLSLCINLLGVSEQYAYPSPVLGWRLSLRKIWQASTTEHQYRASGNFVRS